MNKLLNTQSWTNNYILNYTLKVEQTIYTLKVYTFKLNKQLHTLSWTKLNNYKQSTHSWTNNYTPQSWTNNYTLKVEQTITHSKLNKQLNTQSWTKIYTLES